MNADIDRLASAIAARLGYQRGARSERFEDAVASAVAARLGASASAPTPRFVGASASAPTPRFVGASASAPTPRFVGASASAVAERLAAHPGMASAVAARIAGAPGRSSAAMARFSEAPGRSSAAMARFGGSTASAVAEPLHDRIARGVETIIGDRLAEQLTGPVASAVLQRLDFERLADSVVRRMRLGDGDLPVRDEPVED